MSMHANERLKNLMRAVMRQEPFNFVIETGTYLGLGSTTFIAESFPADRPPSSFITIEANWNAWRKARKNLARFPFISPLWGKSVPTEEALSFIRTDEMLANQQNYPDVYIDNTADPIAFYSNEILGRLQPGWLARPLAWLGEILDAKRHYQGEDLLRRYLRQFCAARPLIVLDSAGGIGFLEFNIVQEIMAGRTYTILLDDIYHIKHYRSAVSIRSDPDFHVIGSDEQGGWMLARRH